MFFFRHEVVKFMMSPDFFKQILDSVTEHIAVVDNVGNIIFVNRGWSAFGDENACLIDEQWAGVNYLEECDKAAIRGDDFGRNSASGIRSVISGECDVFYFEYPCHSPDEKRWFMMRVTSFIENAMPWLVISHQNITERKLAEEKVFNLSRIDGLTGIANRRFFDEFIADEWKRCARSKMPISLAMIDIDFFKLLNDTYGHQVGDECLEKVGLLLNQFAKRPADLCARYGGEEFAIVLGNTSVEESRLLLSGLNEAVRALELANDKSSISPVLTVSIGLTTLFPDAETNLYDLISNADRLLFLAKKNGRNQLVF